jgi:uncharacterized membrane protein YkvI
MFDSWVFRVLVIPSAVFLSVVFGGSYGTGREIMEFVSSHGPWGGVAALSAIFCAYLVLLTLAWSIARQFHAYEYRGFMRHLLGPAWFLYEVVIMVGLVITLAVCTAAAGAISGSHFGLPAWIGSVALLAMVFLLNYRGRVVVEKTMVAAVTALLVFVLALFVQVNGESGAEIASSFRSDQADFKGVIGGLQYALVNGGFIPLMLYCARGLDTRSDALVAAAAAAVVVLIPGVIFHYCFMSAYPEITSEQLPTYWLVEQATGAAFLNAYVLIVFILVIQTGVGLLQGFLERIDAWRKEKTGQPLSSLGHGGVAVAMVLGSMALSSMGIVQLIITGYNILVVCFILVFAVPLLTRGAWLFVRGQTAN